MGIVSVVVVVEVEEVEVVVVVVEVVVVMGTEVIGVGTMVVFKSKFEVRLMDVLSSCCSSVDTGLVVMAELLIFDDEEDGIADTEEEGDDELEEEDDVFSL